MCKSLGLVSSTEEIKKVTHCAAMPGAQDLVRTVLFVAGATVLLFSLVDVCLLTRSEKEMYLRVDSQAQPMNQSHWWISRRR